MINDYYFHLHNFKKVVEKYGKQSMLLLVVVHLCNTTHNSCTDVFTAIHTYTIAFTYYVFITIRQSVSL